MNQAQPNALTVEITQRQWEALQALHMPQTEAEWLALEQEEYPIDVLYGGAKGGGKTWFLCFFAYYYALSVIRFFDLPRANDVPHIGWIGRKVGQIFVGTTLETWKEIIPKSCYHLRGATEKYPRHILIDGRAAIDYGGMDSRQDLERFNSAEYGLIGVDQGEETEKDDVGTLMASRRKKLHHARLGRSIQLPYRGLFTANPRTCWLKTEFIDHPAPGKKFIPALHKDNPNLPKNYVKTLEDSFGHRPDLLLAYRDGNWKALGGIDQVIIQEWITAAATRNPSPPLTKRIVSVDPARYGDDECVILGLENTEIIDAKVMPWCSEPQIVSEAEDMSIRMGDCPIVVESVGLGEGVEDQLLKKKRNTLGYKPGGAAEKTESYCNKRAEVWSQFAKWLSLGTYDEVSVAIFGFHRPENPNLAVVYDRVCEQLMWPTYEFRGQKTLIASKEEIKAKHNGKSPDYADAYVQGVYHLQMILPVATAEQRRRQQANFRAANSPWAF